MTTPEQMTDEALRVEIAEWMGCSTHPEELPNYPACLNAMHEAEIKLSSSRMEIYVEHLEPILGLDGIGIWSYSDAFALCHATARQRAIALVRTIREGV